jgi:ABC-type phosphate/phosphonate transport system substrate-binding protein
VKDAEMRRLTRASVIVIVGGLCLAMPAKGQAPEPASRFRVAFSAGMLSEINEADARAAIDTWGSSFAADRGLSLRPTSVVFSSEAPLFAAIRSRDVDLVALRSDEYLRIAETTRFAALFIGAHQGRTTVEYVLVARRAFADQGVAGLKGGRLFALDDQRSGLAGPWLDTILLEGGLAAAAGHFGTITVVHKLSKAVLPVFFGQADACLVTREGFQTMVELNPQVGRDLTILATSPPTISCVLGLRSGYDPKAALEVTDILLRIDRNPRGQQILSIFGYSHLALASEADVATARALVARYVRASSRGARKQEVPR